MPPLTRSDLKRIEADYQNRFEIHGHHVDTLNSGGLKKQLVRHSVHSQMFDLNNKHVLDVGCGIGMFYEFLTNKNVNIASYTGLDIVDSFLESNRSRFPEARFENIDIFRDPLDSYEPDVVFMSQVFNNRFENADNEAISKEAIERFFKLAKVGIAIDFVTSYVDYKEAYLFYFQPEVMFGFAKSLTPYVVIRHDYLKFEFSLFLYKEPTHITQHSDTSVYSNS